MKKQYAAFVEKSVFHEGDQRSRDFPGHGYGEYTSNHIEVVKFKDEDDMLNWVRRSSDKEKFQLVEYENLEVVKTFTVAIKKG